MAFYSITEFLAPHRATFYIFVTFFSDMGDQLDLNVQFDLNGISHSLSPSSFL